MIFFQIGGFFFNQNQILADCRYIRFTLSELVDQQFKIGNALK
jgi:hypothetical protein